MGDSLRRRPAHPSSAEQRAPAVESSPPSPPARSRSGRACLCCCGCLKKSLLALLATLLLGYCAFVGKRVAVDGVRPALAVRQPYVYFNFAMMRLFRDLSRIKARRRRFAQKDALMRVLMSQDTPLPLADVDGEGRIALTAEELMEYDGRELPGTGERAPLYLSILG
ncbi:MAG: hypothetical protein SGPRY_015095, partial [Prymnesium sp.]